MSTLLCTVFACLSFFASPAFAAFGFNVSGSSLTVDTAAGLVYTVDLTNGNVISLNFNGVEAQEPYRWSQPQSGFPSMHCSFNRGGHSNHYIVISCATDTLTQYYVARREDPAIHMATFTTQGGRMRFITRLRKNILPNGPIPSETDGGEAIEGKDVFMVDGQTRSKFYSSKHFIDDQVHGVSGSGIAAWMIIPGTGYETSSGGPFFRDVDNQGASEQEVYFCMSSGHMQTEPYRQGFHGPYALWFTAGKPPSTFDTTFWDELNITSWVPVSRRGYVKGTASGVPPSYSDKIVIAWNNSDAQYWTRASRDGSFTSPPMKPGTYAQILYKGELAVGFISSVSVQGGLTATSDISDTSETKGPVIWQIGELDGTPAGFRNADLIETAHPSDPRMRPWKVNWTIGQPIADFPLAVFEDIGPVQINFELRSSQIGARTLKIATTSAFAAGRPKVTVNSWEGPSFDPPPAIDSRGITRGTWRGFNQEYIINIPSGVLIRGTNSISIDVLSGRQGKHFLSPNFVFDAISLT